jgi:hypothetical protein
LVDRPDFIVVVGGTSHDKLLRVVEPWHHGRRMKPTASIDDENRFSASVTTGPNTGGHVSGGLGQPACNGQSQ